MTIGIAPIVTLSRGLVRGYCVLGLSSIGLGISGGEGKCGVLIVKNYPAPKDDAFIATTVRWSARRISAGGVICFCMSRDDYDCAVRAIVFEVLLRIAPRCAV